MKPGRKRMLCIGHVFDQNTYVVKCDQIFQEKCVRTVVGQIPVYLLPMYFLTVIQ